MRPEAAIILQFLRSLGNVTSWNIEYSVLKVEDQHKFNICCLIHKTIHHPGNIPTSMNELLLLHKDMHKYNTKNKNDIHATHISNITYCSRKLGDRGRNFWNNLPTALKQETSTNTFKDKLKQHFISTY